MKYCAETARAGSDPPCVCVCVCRCVSVCVRGREGGRQTDGEGGKAGGRESDKTLEVEGRLRDRARFGCEITVPTLTDRRMSGSQAAVRDIVSGDKDSDGRTHKSGSRAAVRDKDSDGRKSGSRAAERDKDSDERRKSGSQA